MKLTDYKPLDISFEDKVKVYRVVDEAITRMTAKAKTGADILSLIFAEIAEGDDQTDEALTILVQANERKGVRADIETFGCGDLKFVYQLAHQAFKHNFGDCITIAIHKD
ncbi:hypothetical protein [Pseudomonas sp.]|uniref:hypothetical protein n=1 Tax=Pseudomonas sp. TaxID=306 RepID=UPI002FCC6B65